MPFASGLPFPIVLTICLVSFLASDGAGDARAPGHPVQIAPPAVDDEQSSAVHRCSRHPDRSYRRFCHLVVAVCGFDVFTTRAAVDLVDARAEAAEYVHEEGRDESRAGCAPLRAAGDAAVRVPATSHPGCRRMPLRSRTGRRTPCRSVGKVARRPYREDRLDLLGRAMTWPSAVTHGAGGTAPAWRAVASVVQDPKRFDAELVVQRFSPVVPFSTLGPRDRVPDDDRCTSGDCRRRRAPEWWCRRPPSGSSRVQSERSCRPRLDGALVDGGEAAPADVAFVQAAPNLVCALPVHAVSSGPPCGRLRVAT